MNSVLAPLAHPVDRAADVLGSQVALAALLGVTKAAVGQWKLEGRQVPLEHCLAIERATNGKVTRADLRPDDYWLIWPDLQPPKRSPKPKLAKAA